MIKKRTKLLATFLVSRIIKFLLDRNAVVTTELTSSHYRRSPLVQGGLEIRSKVTVKIDSSFNTNVFDRYKAKAKELYIEPTNEEILGSFLLEEESASTSRTSVAKNGNINKTKRKSQKSADTPQLEEPRCKHIRNFFTNARNVKSVHLIKDKEKIYFKEETFVSFSFRVRDFSAQSRILSSAKNAEGRHSRKLIPAKYDQICHSQKLIPAKYVIFFHRNFQK